MISAAILALRCDSILTKEILYPYALDENDVLTYIEEVEKETRKEHQYRCPHCGKPMVARKGDVYRPCFAHETKHKCGLESYLHKTAKHILTKRFNNPSIPFWIELAVSHPCKQIDSCPLEKADVCNKWRIHNKYELTQYYSGTALEEVPLKDDAFGKRVQPDVLLRSKDGSRKDIFLEVYYKHKSETDKIATGNRIIEFRIHGLDDLRVLETQELFKEGDDVAFMNFTAIPASPEQIEKEIKEETRLLCKRNVEQYQLPTCKQSIEYRRRNCRWQRLVLFKNGKQSYGGIFADEFEKHYQSAIADITIDNAKIKDPQVIDLIVASRIQRLQNCTYCAHHVCTETVEFCKIGKNGTSRKGSFDRQKGATCRYFEWSDWNKFLLKGIQTDYTEGEDYRIWVNESL